MIQKQINLIIFIDHNNFIHYQYVDFKRKTRVVGKNDGKSEGKSSEKA